MNFNVSQLADGVNAKDASFVISDRSSAAC